MPRTKYVSRFGARGKLNAEKVDDELYGSGRHFDSRTERFRYYLLRTLEEQGVVRSVCQGTSYSIAVNGVEIATYTPDFEYEMFRHEVVKIARGRRVERTFMPFVGQWVSVCEDVKGRSYGSYDPSFGMKIRLMQAVFSRYVTVWPSAKEKAWVKSWLEKETRLYRKRAKLSEEAEIADWTQTYRAALRSHVSTWVSPDWPGFVIPPALDGAGQPGAGSE